MAKSFKRFRSDIPRQCKYKEQHCGNTLFLISRIELCSLAIFVFGHSPFKVACLQIYVERPGRRREKILAVHATHQKQNIHFPAPAACAALSAPRGDGCRWRVSSKGSMHNQVVITPKFRALQVNEQINVLAWKKHDLRQIAEHDASGKKRKRARWGIKRIESQIRKLRSGGSI